MAESHGGAGSLTIVGIPRRARQLDKLQVQSQKNRVNLILRYRNKRIIPSFFTAFKMFSHMPLAVVF